MGKVGNGDQKVQKYLFSEIFYGRQAVSYEELFSRTFWVGGVKQFPRKTFVRCTIRRSRTVSYDPRVFFKNIFLVLCAAYMYLFWAVSL